MSKPIGKVHPEPGIFTTSVASLTPGPRSVRVVAPAGRTETRDAPLYLEHDAFETHGPCCLSAQRTCFVGLNHCLSLCSWPRFEGSKNWAIISNNPLSHYWNQDQICSHGWVRWKHCSISLKEAWSSPAGALLSRLGLGSSSLGTWSHSQLPSGPQMYSRDWPLHARFCGQWKSFPWPRF